MAEPLLKGFYQYKAETEPVTEQDEFDWTKVSEMVNSGIMYEIFGKYRPPLEEYEVLDTLDLSGGGEDRYRSACHRQKFRRGGVRQAPYGRLLSDRNRRKAGERGVYTFRKRGGRPQRKRPDRSVVDREISGNQRPDLSGDPWRRRGCRTGGNTDWTGEPFGENGSDRSGAL